MYHILKLEKTKQYRSSKMKFLHGLDNLKSLRGIDEVNIVKNATKKLFEKTATIDGAYSYLESHFQDAEDIFHIQVPNGTQDVKKLPISKAVFAFVPIQRNIPNRGNVFEIYIRCGGSENRIAYYDTDDDELLADEPERAFIKDSINNIKLTSNETANTLRKQLAYKYPLCLTTTKANKPIFVSTNVDGNDYSLDSKDFVDFAIHALDSLVSKSINMMNNSENNSEQLEIAKMLKLVLGACVKGTFVSDVSSAIALVIVEQITNDFDSIKKRAKYTYEPETFGFNDVFKLDSFGLSAFNACDPMGLTYSELEDTLKAALSIAINRKRNALKDTYEQILNIPQLNEQIADLTTQVAVIPSLNEQVANIPILNQKVEDLQIRVDLANQELQKMQLENQALKQKESQFVQQALEIDQHKKTIFDQNATIEQQKQQLDNQMKTLSNQMLEKDKVLQSKVSEVKQEHSKAESTKNVLMFSTIGLSMACIGLGYMYYKSKKHQS